MIKTESLVNVAVIGIAAFLLLAATPVMAANPRGPVGSSAPEGLDPAFDPWGRARGPNDTNAPGCQLRSCD
jgi:hypothetical protein